MAKQITKTTLLLAFCFFLLVGCQKPFQPITEAVDYTTGKFQLEQKKQTDKTLAKIKCQELCQNTLANDGQDFDQGPCLSNEIIPDWVCDIVHSPRQALDDDPANQCSAFRQGQAHHFVEVNGNCNMINFY